ncbi:CHAD domain-containing protein [Nocardioides cavernae]|uniref:CHAD domain-containing protein n=1 Tax=Nocardioides cavernae TaxID=1921566 RepID=A0ABR8N5F4_9ACTN|nr:CHAD domain-containing protein [Nocardioides cavernae]MBD3923383.1 CHAD domain-containing protein [Nocardioides cavernae]MBM7511694.1 CHAD domain-containing protein [Nocardioides cavernae]
MTVERHPTAADVVRAHLAENVARLHEEEARVRSGETSGVHKMRIAARRLRTSLRTCQPLFEQSTDALSDELRWLGRALSVARDAQVLRERLRDLVSAQPPDLVMGPVDVLIDDELSAAEQRGRAHALVVLGDSRYRRLLDDLDALVRDLPMTGEGARPAGDVFPGLLRRDTKRLRRAVRAAREVESGEAHDAALHNARKKAKRLRYAAELAVPALGEPAEKLASAAEEVQEALGEHQDTVMSRRFLRELGARTHLDGMNGFTLGRLHVIEEARAAAATEDFEHAWAHVEACRIRTRRAS